jgi:hypothetical protein
VQKLAALMVMVFSISFGLAIVDERLSFLGADNWWDIEGFTGRTLAVFRTTPGGRPTAGSSLPGVLAQGVEVAGPARWGDFDLRTFLPFRPGAVFRYEVEGVTKGVMRKLAFHIEGEPEPGAYLVRVTPDGRSFLWLIDESGKALDRESHLLEGRPPELDTVVREPLLRLPNKPLSEDYEKDGLKVYARPVHLSHPGGRFTDCLLVERQEGDEVRYQYYRQGCGLVALEVYERKPGDSPSDPSEWHRAYARYLVESPEGEPASAPSNAGPED